MSKPSKRFSIGVDDGTNSVRAIIADLTDDSEVASAVYHYPGGDAGVIIDPKDPLLARQNPADYINGFYHSVGQAIKKAKKSGAVNRDTTVPLQTPTNA